MTSRDRGVVGQNLFGGAATNRAPNSYPLWRYLLIAFIIAISALYALPNLYPPDYALQITPDGTDRIVDQRLLERAIGVLESGGVEVIGSELTLRGGLIRLASNDAQLRGRKIVDEAFNPRGQNRRFVIALNLASTTPDWLRNIGGKPMAKGLDLSGGVHFVLQVDMDSALAKRLKDEEKNVKALLRDSNIRYVRSRDMVVGTEIRVGFTSDAVRDEAVAVVSQEYPPPGYETVSRNVDGRPGLIITVDESQIREIEDYAIKQNLQGLRNRVNEIGVSEPWVQRLGRSRIIVDLPGVQDASEAKRILDKFANLEFRLVAKPDDRPSETERLVYEGRERILQRDNIVTGDRVTNARQERDPDTGMPQVSITLDSIGGQLMHDATAPNIGHPMAIIFIEQKPRVRMVEVDGEIVEERFSVEERRLISVATIQAALGYRFRITGLGMREAQDLALLLRAGALAAPMYIVEERTVGASLGEENIEKGMLAVGIGFALVLAFMLVYYKLFGLVANVALTLNLMIMVAVMSLLGATLTLPGIAGIVLTVGMAVDANVLIFSRIREELKERSPQHAIQAGYDRAFVTILDANLTTLFVALILLSIGSGPVAGFAVTLAIGIVTSMFTAIVVSRALVNLIYGGRRVEKLSI
ncbi:MAG: protein translocase subunit SecD [Gammaproteobacteria bacterium]|nr:protein translocase subunit SecD [Gammaproteobacteria bacterium]